MKYATLMLAGLTLSVGPASLSPCLTGYSAMAQAAEYSCCKTCRKGKACGDSCIASSKTCRKGPGCACNG